MQHPAKMPMTGRYDLQLGVSSGSGHLFLIQAFLSFSAVPTGARNQGFFWGVALGVSTSSFFIFRCIM